MFSTFRRLQRRLGSLPLKYGRLGATGMFAVAALILIFVAGWLVDRHTVTAADRHLMRVANNARDNPVDVVARAARANRVVFLSDIHNSSAVKELAAQAITRIATMSGLDVVVVEVGADQQLYIDQYFDHTPEDASVLLSHGRTIGEPGSATRAFLDIYRAVWKVNRSLGAGERIRVIAADLPGWPEAAISPSETAHKLAEREAYMRQTINSEVLDKIPDARILVFMSGLHALKQVDIAVASGGTKTVTVTPLANQLSTSIGEVYSILADAPASGLGSLEAVPYLGTRVGEVLAANNFNRRFGMELTRDFDYLRQPLRQTRTPGIEYSINPRDYRLSTVADAYVNLGR